MLPRWVQSNHKGPYNRVTRVLKSGRGPCDKGSRDLNVGAMGQGLPATTSNWKRRGTNVPLAPLEKAALQYLEYSPTKLTSYFSASQVKENKFALF